MYDYQASLTGISERVGRMHRTEWSRTPEVRELNSLAMDLAEVADRLDPQRWLWLEQAFEAGDPEEIGLDGLPIAPSEPRPGRFTFLRRELQDLAETARKQAASLPDSRRREYLDYCADLFLHVRNECGMERPSLYDQSEAVADFAAVCEQAEIYLSRERLRGLLAAAMKRFDASYIPEGLSCILVTRR